MYLKNNYIERTIRRLYRTITGKNKRIKLFEEIKPGDTLWGFREGDIIQFYVSSISVQKLSPLGHIGVEISCVSNKTGKEVCFYISPDKINKTEDEYNITTDYNIVNKWKLKCLSQEFYCRNYESRQRYKRKKCAEHIPSWCFNYCIGTTSSTTSLWV